MASLEECTWHERHVVWKFPLNACVHVTHGTRIVKGKYPWLTLGHLLCGEISQNERGDILRNSLGEKKQFGGERKRKEKEKKEKKKRRKTKSVRGKGENERREKEESRPCTLQFPVFRRSEVDRLRIKVGILDKSYK